MNDKIIYSHIDTEDAFLVEGIEEWIQQLLPISELNVEDGTFLRMKDLKTNAIFLIRRIE